MRVNSHIITQASREPRQLYIENHGNKSVNSCLSR